MNNKRTLKWLRNIGALLCLINFFFLIKSMHSPYLPVFFVLSLNCAVMTIICNEEMRRI